MFYHIYREFNSKADDLSKWAIGPGEGKIVWEENIEDCLVDSGTLYLYWASLLSCFYCTLLILK